MRDLRIQQEKGITVLCSYLLHISFQSLVYTGTASNLIYFLPLSSEGCFSKGKNT